MKLRGALEIVTANAVILALLYLVAGDLATRSAYAAREGLGFLFNRSFLVQVSSLQGSRGTLNGPLSLDWVQLLVAAVIVIDVLFAYGLVERRRAARVPAV